MTPEEIAVLKKALQYVKIARMSDYPTFNMMMASDTFKDIIQTLEEIADWNEEDEQGTVELSERLAEETKYHTFSEKAEKLTNILAVGDDIAATIIAGRVILVHGREKDDNTEKH